MKVLDLKVEFSPGFASPSTSKHRVSSCLEVSGFVQSDLHHFLEIDVTSFDLAKKFLAEQFSLDRNSSDKLKSTTPGKLEFKLVVHLFVSIMKAAV